MTESAKPRSSAVKPYAGLLILLIIFLAVTVIYGLLLPLGESADETAHMTLAAYIGREGHLPRNIEERHAAGYKSDTPMLYHMTAGAATRWVDYDALPQLRATGATPRRLLVEDGLSTFVMLHTEDEAFPFQGIALAWHLARLVSALLSAGTLIVVYHIVLAIRPGDHWLALGVTTVAAALSQFHLIAASVNDDNLLGLFCALFTLVLVRTWRHPERVWSYVWLGLWMGLALTSKYSVSLFPLLVLAVLVRALVGKKISLLAAAGRLAIFGVVMGLSAGWWFVYVGWYFNAIQEMGVLNGLVKAVFAGESADISLRHTASVLTAGVLSAPRDALPSDATLWDWAVNLFQSFWIANREMRREYRAIYDMVFLLVSLLAAGGLLYAWRRRDDRRKFPRAWPWGTMGLLAFQILLLIPFPILRFYLTGNPVETGQGRHIIFPAAAAVSFLLTAGISSWFAESRRRWVGFGLAGFLFAASLINFWALMRPSFPEPLPVRSAAAALEDSANQAGLAVGDGIDLAAFEIGEPTSQGILPVKLMWQAGHTVNHDYLFELSLLDSEGTVRSLAVSHPVDGRYPTRVWEAGDVVRDDLWLPLVGVEAGEYSLRVRLCLPDNVKGLDCSYGQLHVADLSLPDPPTRPASDSLRFSDGSQIEFLVWQPDVAGGKLPGYGYRAAIPVSVWPQPGAGPVQGVWLVGPDGAQRAALAQGGNVYDSVVGADWENGEYRLRVEVGGDTVDSAPLLRTQIRPRNFDIPPMDNQVQANFGDDLLLLGFDLDQRRVEAGGAFPVTVYWQAKQVPRYHYLVFNHLLNDVDLRQWGGRDRVPQEFYSTLLWVPGEVVRDEYLVPVDPDAPAGTYRLDIGLYVEEAGQAHSVPLVADGEMLDANSVTLALVKVDGPPPGATVDAVMPQNPRTDNLADLVTLTGYDLEVGESTLDLTLYWRCDAPLPADYTTFVHVYAAPEESGPLVAQTDRPPVDGAYPSSLWDVGEIVRDAVQVPLPPDLAAGEYEIVVGLYDYQTGQRLPVLDEQGEIVSDHVRLDQKVIR